MVPTAEIRYPVHSRPVCGKTGCACDALEDSLLQVLMIWVNRYAQTSLIGNHSIQQRKEPKEKLGDYAVRLVLTAHPTQFYPGPVLYYRMIFPTQSFRN
jgi:hypothetical protein